MSYGYEYKSLEVDIIIMKNKKYIEVICLEYADVKIKYNNNKNDFYYCKSLIELQVGKVMNIFYQEYRTTYW